MPEQFKKQSGEAGGGDDGRLGEGGGVYRNGVKDASGRTLYTQKPRNARLSRWWAHTDSNRGPKDYELPGELLCLEKSFVGERRLA